MTTKNSTITHGVLVVCHCQSRIRFFGGGGSSFVVSKRKVRLRINIGFNHHCIATLVLDLKHSDCNPLKERTELQ